MNYYDEIKNQIIHNIVTKRIKDYSKNRSDLQTYYNIGKLLAEAGKHYGEGIIKEYSIKLTREFGKGYGISNLKNMRNFYKLFSKSQAVPDQLTWSHYTELLKFDNHNIINYYIDISLKFNLSYRQLRQRIKNNEYERLDEETKYKLLNQEKLEVKDFIKNPIVIHNHHNYEMVSEKVLQKLILEDMTYFLKELGNNFSFIANEYKIKIGNHYNYIDLLLYNIEYQCYVVIELKVTELKKEYIGQIEVYMNYIDSHMKTIYQDQTIGIIICKKDNKYIMEYCSDERIICKEYEFASF